MQPAEVQEIKLGSLEPGQRIEITGKHSARYELTATRSVHHKDGRAYGLTLRTFPRFNESVEFPNVVSITHSIGYGRAFEVYRFEDNKWLIALTSKVKIIRLLD